MKEKAFTVVLIIAAGLASFFAQGTNQVKSFVAWQSGVTAPHPVLTYDKKAPPRLSLANAYILALNGLGADTNEYYCVSATCLDPTPTTSNIGMHGMQGWTFKFSNTNDIQRQVLVYFDKATWVQPAAKDRGSQF